MTSLEEPQEESSKDSAQIQKVSKKQRVEFMEGKNL